VDEVYIKIGVRKMISLDGWMRGRDSYFELWSGRFTSVIKTSEKHIVSVQRVKAIKIGGCINVGAFTIEKDTSEDSTIVDIMGDGLLNRIRRASDSIDVVVLEMFGK
jgi:hypothetical protein